MPKMILTNRRSYPNVNGEHIVDVECPACGEHDTLSYLGWIAVVCPDCGGKAEHPDRDLLEVLDAAQEAYDYLRLLAQQVAETPDSMTEFGRILLAVRGEALGVALAAVQDPHRSSLEEIVEFAVEDVAAAAETLAEDLATARLVSGTEPAEA